MRWRAGIVALVLMAVAGAAMADDGPRDPGSTFSRASGVGELQLDRAAVRAILSAAVADDRELELPPLGRVRLSFQTPRSVAFREGGIETTLPFGLAVGDADPVRANLQVRLLPELDRLTGRVRFVAERATVDVGLPGRLDVKAIVPPIALPRGLSGNLPESVSANEPGVDIFIHAVRVEPERFIIKFGLSVGQRTGGAGRDSRRSR